MNSKKFLLLLFVAASITACGSENDKKVNEAGTENLEERYIDEIISIATAVEGDYEIYLVNINLGMATRLTTNESYDSEGKFSPNGKDFLFVSEFLKGERENKQVIKEDGSTEWVSKEISGDRDIFLITPEEGRTRLSDNISTDQHVSWSPDGKEIVFSGGAMNQEGQSQIEAADELKNFEIIVMNLESGENRQITHEPFEDWYPSWSPDGKEIVFASIRTGNFQLFITDIEGNKVRQLTELEGVNWTPSWSPNGDRIAFASNSTGNYEIFVIDPNGNNLQQLTNDPSVDTMPIWSPDGKRIAFASDRSGPMGVHTMDANGENEESLGWSGFPTDWSIPQISLKFFRPE